MLLLIIAVLPTLALAETSFNETTLNNQSPSIQTQFSKLNFDSSDVANMGMTQTMTTASHRTQFHQFHFYNFGTWSPAHPRARNKSTSFTSISSNLKEQLSKSIALVKRATARAF